MAQSTPFRRPMHAAANGNGHANNNPLYQKQNGGARPMRSFSNVLPKAPPYAWAGGIEVPKPKSSSADFMAAHLPSTPLGNTAFAALPPKPVMLPASKKEMKVETNVHASVPPKQPKQALPQKAHGEISPLELAGIMVAFFVATIAAFNISDWIGYRMAARRSFK